MERLLGLVERSLGAGEAVPDAEWEALRSTAAGHARSLELVERLRTVVAECDREIAAGHLGEPDAAALRTAILDYVRRTVSEKKVVDSR
jgi:hypothetical protein